MELLLCSYILALYWKKIPYSDTFFQLDINLGISMATHITIMYNIFPLFLSYKEAIDMAWDLLTRVYMVPKDRLYVTYFGGCKEFNLDPDVEVQQIWLDMG